MFINRCGTMVLPFLTIYLTSEFGWSEAVAGQMISVYGLGSICGAYLGGRLADKVGAIRLQTICMFLTVPAFLVLPLCTRLATKSTALFCLSVIADAVRPANATAIAKLTDAKVRTRAFALQRLAANLGFSFGPAIGGLLAKISFTLLFVADAATTLLAASMLLWSFRFKRIEKRATTYQDSTLRASPLRDRQFVYFLLLTLATTVVFIQFLSTYPLYLRDHYQLDEPRIGAMFAVNTAVIVLFEMVLIDAIRNWPLLRTISLGSFLACVGFGILPLGSSIAFCVFAMLVLTAGEMLSMPLSVGYVAERSPPGREGPYMGWYTVTHSAAFVLGPALGALIYGWDRDAVWLASLNVSAAVLIGFLALSEYARGGTTGARDRSAIPQGALGET
jgi:predicted MFS family arabinose efflux permease